LLKELIAAVNQANAGEDVRGTIVTGDNSHLSAGPDVNIREEIDSPEQAMRMLRIYQEAFDRTRS
jgi:enoyl-CoA hydratase/carnithine racemase